MNVLQVKFGITLSLNWVAPGDFKPEDLEAAERCMQFEFGWFAAPILLDGKYPEVMREKVSSTKVI